MSTQRDYSLMGAEHVRQYLATDGAIGHHWNGVHCLILSTNGHKSGKTVSVPLIYGNRGDDVVVVASRGGSQQHPFWYLNLSADPNVEVQVAADRFPATARTASGDERDQLWALMTSIWPDYDTYQSRTDREIPVVVLSRQN